MTGVTYWVAGLKRHQLFLLLLASSLALASSLVLGACGAPGGNSDKIPGYEGTELPKDLPYSKLIRKIPPALRQDTFYKTEIEDKDGKRTLTDRFVSNGRGFIAYAEDKTFIDGYYLFNFSGHSSLFVQPKERKVRVALVTPADNLILAYEDYVAHAGSEPLGNKEIAGHDCEGFRFSKGDQKIENWYDRKNNLLVAQRAEAPGLKIDRQLVRFNPVCETTFLRLPQGYEFVSDSGQVQK